MTSPLVLFSGSGYGSPGIYTYRPGGRRGRVYEIKGWPFGASLDAVYPPGGMAYFKPRYSGERWSGMRVEQEPQGLANLVHKGGWTVLAFWDRSGPDKRGGINTAFAIEGRHNFDRACELAREAFPEIWERFPFMVELSEEVDCD